MRISHGPRVLRVSTKAQDVRNIVQLEAEVFQDSRAQNELPGLNVIRYPCVYGCCSFFYGNFERHFSHKV